MILDPYATNFIHFEDNKPTFIFVGREVEFKTVASPLVVAFFTFAVMLPTAIESSEVWFIVSFPIAVFLIGFLGLSFLEFREDVACQKKWEGEQDRCVFVLSDDIPVPSQVPSCCRIGQLRVSWLAYFYFKRYKADMFEEGKLHFRSLVDL